MQEFLSWPAFVILCGSLLVAWANFWIRSPRRKKEREGLVFLGAIVSILGAFSASSQQTANEQRVAELNEYIASSITGGNSFAYIGFPLVAPSTYGLTIIHQGKYPLYDLGIRIVDLAKWERKQPRSLYDLQKDEQHLNIGNLAASQASVLGPVQIDSDFTRWNIFFSARNGYWTQLLRIRRVGNELKFALQVKRSSQSGEGETIFEKVDPGYPRTEDGRVEWGEDP
jgi:hypothetical protein